LSKRITILLIVFSIFIINFSYIYGLETDNINDELNYLSEEEINEIQDKIEDTVEAYGLDIVIVITDDTEGKNSMNYADDYYDYNGYGVGDDYSGLLMLINMDKRELWISTTGKAIDIFTDYRIDIMVDEITALLGNGKYKQASDKFISLIEKYAIAGIPNDATRKEETAGQHYRKEMHLYWYEVVYLMKSPLIAIIALVVAIGLTFVITITSKGHMGVSSRTYESNFRLTNKVDNFIRESVTRSRASSSSSGSSSIGSSISSTHTSSSGRSHGGGGGRF